MTRRWLAAVASTMVLGACGGGSSGPDGGSPPGATTTAGGAAFDAGTAEAPFDPCEALVAAATELSIPLYENIEPTTLELPGTTYVSFTCSAPIDDGRSLTLNMKAVALSDPAAVREELDALGEAFGGVTVVEGLEGLPDGSWIAQGANGENPELYVLATAEPFAVSVVGGGTNADLGLAKEVARFLLDRS